MDESTHITLHDTRHYTNVMFITRWSKITAHRNK